MSTLAHILVADDDEQLRTALEEQLIAEGYEVTLAIDGSEAIDIMKRKEVDVAVIDVKMPKMNGFQVLEFIKKNFPKIKTIILTAYADIESIKRCKDFGADDVIEKPYDLGDLFDSIHFVTKK